MAGSVKKIGQRTAYEQGLEYIREFARESKVDGIIEKMEKKGSIGRTDFFKALDYDNDGEWTRIDPFTLAFSTSGVDEYIERHFPELMEKSADGLVIDFIKKNDGGTIPQMFGNVEGAGFRRYQMITNIGPLREGAFGFYEFDVTLKKGSTVMVRISGKGRGMEGTAASMSVARMQYQKFLIDCSKTVPFSPKLVYNSVQQLLLRAEGQVEAAEAARLEEHQVPSWLYASTGGSLAVTAFLAADIAGFGWVSGANPAHLLQRFHAANTKLTRLQCDLEAFGTLDTELAGDLQDVRGRSGAAVQTRTRIQGAQAAHGEARGRLEAKIADAKAKVEGMRPDVDRLAGRLGMSTMELELGAAGSKKAQRAARTRGTLRRSLTTKAFRGLALLDLIQIGALAWGEVSRRTSPPTEEETLMANFTPLFSEMSFEEFGAAIGNPDNGLLRQRLQIFWWYLNAHQTVDGHFQANSTDIASLTSQVVAAEELLAQAEAELQRLLQEAQGQQPGSQIRR